MKILLIDIETSPNTAYVWGLFKQNINIGNIIDTGRVMCFAAKWLGENKVHFHSENEGRTEMLNHAWALLDDADVVIHYNGKKFDIPTLNKEFIMEDMPPPSPFTHLDLLNTSRQQFRFTSNKLDFVAQQLGLGEKTKHTGFQLWIDCMAGDTKAWKLMEKYNKQDVILLEKLYNRYLPWIKNHPNIAVGDDLGHVCPSCGSEELVQRGTRATQAGLYQRFRCNGCGSWSQSRTKEKNDAPTPKAIL